MTSRPWTARPRRVLSLALCTLVGSYACGQSNDDGAPPAFETGDATAGDGAPNDDGGVRSNDADVDAHVGSLALRAGGLGGEGNVDGTGTMARFNFPGDVAVDGAGNVFVADQLNQTIRKVTPAGVVTTFAGAAGVPGSADGTGTAARFHTPLGVATDSAGNVFVSDEGNNLIRRITPSGVVTTVAGTAGAFGSTDGTGAAARFFDTRGVAVDGAGNVFVADANGTIRKITPAGVVTTLAGVARMTGSTDGAGTAARFNLPTGVAVDGAGNVLVADTNNHTIRKITPAGVVTTLAGLAGAAGSSDGIGNGARFNLPFGVTADGAGNVFVADTVNDTLRKITPGGLVTTVAGTAGAAGSVDGTGAAARFDGPSGLAIGGAGNLIVADNGNNQIRKMTPAGVVTTLAGAANVEGSADGTGAAARFSFPSGVAVDTANNAFVVDPRNCVIRKVTAAGVATTFAGTAQLCTDTDGSGAAARFGSPEAIAVDGAGNVFVTEAAHNTIRKITAGGVVTTFAGTAFQAGITDGTGAAARFNSPKGIAADAAGNVFVADTDSNTIRKITPAGVVTTLAGKPQPPGSADGAGAAARFNKPQGLAVDAAGNVFVADTFNNLVRRITPAGVVTTVASAPSAGAVDGGAPGESGSQDGTRASARFNGPVGVAVDGSGNVYVADADNFTIRKITPAGVVTTIAGVAGRQRVQLGPLPASLNLLGGIAVTASGNLVVTSEGAVLDVLLN